MKLRTPMFWLTLLLTIAAVPLHAQAVGAAASLPRSVGSTGPSMDAVSVAAHPLRTQSSDALNLALAPRRRTTRPVAMMVVGVAAMIVGGAIGDTPGTIVLAGGAVVALLGLFEYLQ